NFASRRKFQISFRPKYESQKQCFGTDSLGIISYKTRRSLPIVTATERIQTYLVD
ncbi:hypothetical protein X975_07568, partial [Stegodyphus mimosarum]